MLFVDSKEKASTKELVSFVAGPATVLNLECADFVLFDQDGHSLGIERKGVSDLLGSLSHRNSNGNVRLPDQLERMSQTYSHRMLVVEGTLNFNVVSRKIIIGRRDFGWHHGSVQMILWGIESDGVSILYTADKHATADLLRVLHQRALKGCVLPRGLREEEMTEDAAA